MLKGKILRGILAIIITALVFPYAPSSLAESDNQSIKQKVEGDFAKMVEYPSLDKKDIPYLIYARSYALMDEQTTDLVVSKNETEKLPVASITKMMTAILTIENLKLDDIVEIRKSATLVSGGKVNLLTNEKITVLNLLKCLLINSGNDAAQALAQAYTKSDDITPWVELMNKKAAQLGLADTKYFDTAGLSAEAYSTARDQLNLARILLRTEPLDEIVATAEETVTSTTGAVVHQLKNTNRLVRNDNIYYLSGVTGVKTGFTGDAGHCLVSSYTFNGKKYLAIVLNTNESTTEASAKEVRKLFLLVPRIKYAKYFGTT